MHQTEGVAMQDVSTPIYTEQLQCGFNHCVLSHCPTFGVSFKMPFNTSVKTEEYDVLV